VVAATKAKKKQATRKRPKCHTCGKTIHMPEGWSVGPSVRRHYWKHHRDTMQVER
jgi:transposase-like protein